MVVVIVVITVVVVVVVVVLVVVVVVSFDCHQYTIINSYFLRWRILRISAQIDALNINRLQFQTSG